MNKVLFLLIFLCTQVVFSQEVTVLDFDTREPISNVAIYNYDRTKTALTDFDGKVDLKVFGVDERITFRHLSYQLGRTTKAQIQRHGDRFFLSMKAEELDEVVMSVSKWEQQKKDIPNKIAVINARDIAFTNPQTSADLLQSSGKVFVQKSQLGGGSPMIRGFATNRLLLSVDGVRMNNAIFRGGNLQNVISIDPYTIQNTEVIFGPGSVIYGSDAIGGVMNFYTKKAEFSTSDSLSFSGGAKYRFASANSENTFHFDFNLGKRKWAFLTSASYNDFGDLKMGGHGPESYLRKNFVGSLNGTDVLLPNENPKKQTPTGYSQLNLMQKIAYTPNNTWEHKLGLHYSETSDYARYDRLIRPNKAGDGLRSAEWFYGPQKWFMGNLQMSKRGKGIFYDGLKITTAYQHFEESRNDRDFGDLLRYTTEEKVDALSANVDFENKKIGDLRLYYGGEYIFNKVGSTGEQVNIETKELVEGASRYPDGATWQTLAGYVNGEYRAKPNFTLLSGLRYSHVWINAVFDKTFYPFPFDDAMLDNGALTGSIGFSWFPKADLQITLNGSTGFRAPNLDDVGKIFDSEPGAVVVPNPDLEPEYAYNVELGVQKNFNDRVVLKSAAFYTYLVDALVRRDYKFNGEDAIMYNGELSSVQAIQNAAKAYVYGLEFGAEVFFGDKLSAVANLTLTEGIEEEDDGTESPGRHVAPTFGDLHFIYKGQKLTADLFLNYNGEISYGDLATSERSKTYIYAVDEEGNPFSPSWYTLNLRAQYAITNALKTSLGVENITDQRYRSYSSGIVAPGVNLVLGVDYRF
ncbi:TonB-dependent receptor plug domain-containing protein [Zobellia galactanivorans]|uniref:TonB-dependent receptor plug domain-containing protein n=1 Tax=Zobellia galactanivorans (strain DSM 12802 / CCUG 47099 / CIP 106680 / NCIMB 13871 / Dsij) TaxID=63186 RepID=UPI001C07A1C0|nr:TonB-dependent receptor [Zobellia galactanivorans]MBU3028029.1 TonB-dependent receptor [Zobellia galactanivorans]